MYWLVQCVTSPFGKPLFYTQKSCLPFFNRQFSAPPPQPLEGSDWGSGEGGCLAPVWWVPVAGCVAPTRFSGWLSAGGSGDYTGESYLPPTPLHKMSRVLPACQTAQPPHPRRGRAIAALFGVRLPH